MALSEDVIKLIPIPTNYDVGTVNLYLIMEEPFTLVDAGPYSAEGEEHFMRALEELKVAPGEIKRIVITHAHPDHLGMAGRLQELTGATVLLSRNDYTKLTAENPDLAERRQMFVQAGVPDEVIEQINQTNKEAIKIYFSNLDFDRVQVVEDGQSLDFRSCKMRIIYTPGHTPGHLSLYYEEGGMLFGGDNLLEGISPNPVMEPDPERGGRYKSLPNLLASLELLSGLKINQVYPAHGQPFSHYKEVIRRFFAHFYKREEKVLSMVDNQEKTAYQLASLLHPKVRGIDVFLALSRTIGHLDLLVCEGRVREQEKAGQLYYSLAQPAEKTLSRECIL